MEIFTENDDPAHALPNDCNGGSGSTTTAPLTGDTESLTLPAGAIGNSDPITFNVSPGLNGSFILTLPANSPGVNNPVDLTFTIPAGATSFELPIGAIGNSQAFTLELPSGFSQG